MAGTKNQYAGKDKTDGKNLKKTQIMLIQAHKIRKGPF